MIIIITLLALFIMFMNFSICKSIPQWEKDISDREQEKFLRDWCDKK